MRYDISKHKAPEMPKLGKGTECIKILLSQASKDMHTPSFRCFSLYFGTYQRAKNFSLLTSIGRNYVA